MEAQVAILFYEYTPSTNTWIQKASIPGPSARAWATSFSVNGKAYVVGGDSTFGGLLNDVWEYDPSTNIWTQKADFLGGARDGMFCWVIQDKVYMGGGFDGASILNDFYQYDPDTDVWTYKGVLPSPILFASSFVLNDKGYITMWEGGGFYNNLFEYDPTTNVWTERMGCPGVARGEGIGFAFNGVGYSGLGQTDFDTTYRDMYRYDPDADSWTSLPDEFPINNTGWSTSFVIGDYVYAGSGTSLPDFTFTNKFYKKNLLTTTGVKNEYILSNPVTVYPLPAQEVLHINTANNLNAYTFFDQMGRKVMEGHLDDSNTIDITQLHDGLYVMQLTEASGMIVRKMVIIKRV